MVDNRDTYWKLVRATTAVALLLIASLLTVQADAPQTAAAPPAPIFLTSEANDFVVDPTPTATPSPTPVPTEDPTPTPEPAPDDWFSYLNSMRDMADLPHLGRVTQWCDAGELHARYMVKNNTVSHSETYGNEWYSSEGNAIAQSGNVLGTWTLDATDKYAIDSWMQSPFHAIGVLDPKLQATGYGSYREDIGNIRMAAVLDVIRGRGTIPSSVEYPVMWPGDGSTVGITTHLGGCYPNPLSSCPGYTTPSGTPIIMQIGSGYVTPNVTAHSLKKNGNPVESCLFTEVSYDSPNSSEEYLARSIMAARDAIVIMPRNKLSRGAVYTVSVTVNGQTHEWSFNVATLTADAPVEAAFAPAEAAQAPAVPAQEPGAGPKGARGMPG